MKKAIQCWYYLSLIMASNRSSIWKPLATETCPSHVQCTQNGAVERSALRKGRHSVSFVVTLRKRRGLCGSHVPCYNFKTHKSGSHSPPGGNSSQCLFLQREKNSFLPRGPFYCLALICFTLLWNGILNIWGCQLCGLVPVLIDSDRTDI
jgi:hypothetical protein